MKRFRSLLFMSGLAAVASLATGCGDNGVRCGDGTHAEDGLCVPDGSSTDCGPGTVLAGDQCVPDGSVVCEQGTMFDAATGTCIVDPSACADGTTLVDGTCVPDDELLMDAADHVEAAEPNGPGGTAPAGNFAAPALDQSTTFYGCITATEDADDDGNLDADLDTWLVTASGPMVLEVTTDGLGGLSAGFIAVSADATHPATLDAWQRIGINLTGDTAKREIYLPAAGRYALFVTDARSLFLGDAGAGTADTCYFATVKHVATPTATALTLPTTAGTDNGKVKVYSHPATATGDVLDLQLEALGPALQPAFVSLRGTALHRAPAAGTDALGDPIPPFDTIGGLDAGEVVSVIVDAEYNYGLAPQAFRITTARTVSQSLPTTGGMVTVTNANNGVSPLTIGEVSLLYFDVATAGVKRVQLTASIPVDLVIVRRDLFTGTGAVDTFSVIDNFGASGITALNGEFVRFLTPGRYYLLVNNPAATAVGGTYTITSTVSDQATTALTFGTALTSQALTNGNSFHSLDLTAASWIEFGATATTDWGANNALGVESYDLAGEGWLRTGTAPATVPVGNLYPVFAAAQPAATPFTPFGRIVASDPRDYLVRVRPSGSDPLGAAPTFSLLVQNRAGVVDLGLVAPGAPTMQTATGLATTTAPARFIIRSTAGNTVRALAHPTNALTDIRIRRINANEGTVSTVDSATLGTDESFGAGVSAAPNNWVAWTIDNKTAATTTDVEQTVTVILPRPYTIASGTLPWADACTGGVLIGADRDDEILTAQALPAAFATFQLFGEAVPATHRVGANGWLSFDTGTVSFGAYQNRQIPTAGPPDGVIAPFWQDLDTVTQCRKDDAVAGTVTYQWTGRVYETTPAVAVQFQVVLHATGAIDFIYGPMHVANGAFADSDTNGATVGAENLSGTFGHQVHYNTASVAANTSRTLTPM